MRLPKIIQLFWMKLNGGFWVYLPYSERWEDYSGIHPKHKDNLQRLNNYSWFRLKIVDFDKLSWTESLSIKYW